MGYFRGVGGHFPLQIEEKRDVSMKDGKQWDISSKLRLRREFINCVVGTITYKSAIPCNEILYYLNIN